jgi:hypothetical protein
MAKVLYIVIDLVRQYRIIWAAGFEGVGQPSSDTIRRSSDLDPLFGDLHF